MFYACIIIVHFDYEVWLSELTLFSVGAYIDTYLWYMLV
jgi:hypothetical protein